MVTRETCHAQSVMQHLILQRTQQFVLKMEHGPIYRTALVILKIYSLLIYIQ